MCVITFLLVKHSIIHLNKTVFSKLLIKYLFHEFKARVQILDIVLSSFYILSGQLRAHRCHDNSLSYFVLSTLQNITSIHDGQLHLST